MDQTNNLREDGSINEKLPIIEVKLSTQKDHDVNANEVPDKFDGATFQFFLVLALILVNISLYYASIMTSASAPRTSPASPDKPVSRAHEVLEETHSCTKNAPPSWELAVAKAQTDEPFVSFDDLAQYCTDLSPTRSADDCVVDTISSMVLYSETLLSLRQTLLHFATPSTPNKAPFLRNRRWKPAPENIAVPFQRTAPTSITDEIGINIHHIGFHCPDRPSCNKPLFSITTHAGVPLLFTYPPPTSSTTSQALTFAFGNTTTDWSNTSGVDMRFDISAPAHPILNPQTDYPPMRAQLECLVTDNLSTPGIFFSIRNAGTFASVFRGTFSPWTFGAESKIEGMQQVDVPEWNLGTCEMRQEPLGAYAWGIFGCLAVVGVVGVMAWSWWTERRKGSIRL